LFFGKASYYNLSLFRHVGFGDLTIALLGVMGILLFIAINEDLDTESPPKSAKIEEALSYPREPEFLHAEILPPEEDKSSRHRPDGDSDDY